jgi:hypothetical protein
MELAIRLILEETQDIGVTKGSVGPVEEQISIRETEQSRSRCIEYHLIMPPEPFKEGTCLFAVRFFWRCYRNF